ncbi:DUF559 domain-containing protein [Nocardioides limicola]|uniref:DUF559 domain-containing protein n=1 Tax=Nocardioides limicola TaxID=2803368 RepID=UPI001EF0D2F7|nr:DUF559 domain-containing protein [Nocardioides sp. DJM-14]
METTELPDHPFSHSEAVAFGCTPHQLESWVRSGLLRRPFRGIYVPSSVAWTEVTRAQALARATPADHVLIDRSAAAMLGVDTFPIGELARSPRLEYAAPPEGHPSDRPGVDGRTRDLLPRDITECGGVRVTTPLRTALDLGCNLRRREAFAAMNALASTYGLSRDDLIRELPRFKGRRGVRQLRELIPLLQPLVESPRESWTLLALIDAGLPAPEPQVWIHIDGEPVYRLDFAYQQARVCVEYDGEEAHSSPEQRAHDERRRAWLRRNGWIVIVVRAGDFTGAALDTWIAEVRAALATAYSTRRW